MLEMLLMCFMCFFFVFMSFFLGLHYGSKVKNNERIEIPDVNIAKAIKEHKKDKERREKQEKEMLIEEINLANIEAYDGTGLGQKDIPR